VLGLCLLIAFCLREARQFQSPGASSLSAPAGPARTPSETARRQARLYRQQAYDGAELERFQLVEWDPAGTTGIVTDAWVRDQVAQSPAMAAARQEAVRAMKLARTADEIYQAVKVLALIECERGHHVSELQQARLLMASRPRSAESLRWLYRAARCNHLKGLERKALASLQSLSLMTHSQPLRTRRSF
jgi:hypothetical protein